MLTLAIQVLPYSASGAELLIFVLGLRDMLWVIPCLCIYVTGDPVRLPTWIMAASSVLLLSLAIKCEICVCTADYSEGHEVCKPLFWIR